MVHLQLDAEHGDSDQQHAQRFVMRANRLGRMLGLRPVAPGSDAAVEWPQSVRKKGYASWRAPE